MIKRITRRARSVVKPKKKRPPAKPKMDLAAARAYLDGLRPKTQQAANVIALLRSWLDDESGYDEEALPELTAALDAERKRHGARRLFDG